MKKPSVYQRKSDSRWVGSVELDRVPGEKRNRKVVYGNTEKEVWEKLNEILFEIQTGQYVAPARDTLIEYLKDYYKINAGYDAWDNKAVRPDKAKWEETTAELYKMYIDVHLGPYFKDMKLRDIKTITLDTYYNYKLTHQREQTVKQRSKTIKKKLDPLSINTVIKLHKFLKAALNYAVINDKIKKNPTDGVILSSPEKYKPNVYNEKQFLELLNHVHGTDDEIPIILGAGCGFRRGEICGLKWEDVDFNNRMITIKKTITNFVSNVEKKPKNETSARQISAPQYVIDILALYYDKKENPDLAQHVITRWKPKSLSERFKLLLEKFGMPPTRLHDLRHYNAVIMLNSGIPDKVAAERLGHANVSTLREVYQHVIKDMDEAAADKINNAIKPKEGKPLSKEDKKAKFKIV